MSNADNTVLTCAMLTLGSTTAAHVLPTDVGGQGELPPARLLIGTSLTFIGLSMLAPLAPKLAVPLSALIAVTALTYYGIPIADNAFNGAHNSIGLAGSSGIARPKNASQGVKVKTPGGNKVKVDTGNILGLGGFRNK